MREGDARGRLEEPHRDSLAELWKRAARRYRCRLQCELRGSRRLYLALVELKRREIELRRKSSNKSASGANLKF